MTKKKEEYVKPAMRVVQVRMVNQLLAGSSSTNSGDVEATMDDAFTEGTW